MPSGYYNLTGLPYKHTEEYKNRVREWCIKNHIAPPEETRHHFEKGYIPYNKGKKLPPEVGIKMGLSRTGEKHWNWKNGGTQPLMLQIRHCNKYKKWNREVMEIQDFTCQLCGVRGGRLNVHHMKPFAKIIKDNKINSLLEALVCEELWDINNGLTVCNYCHLVKIHKFNYENKFYQPRLP
jgi:hypothetical protein